VHIIDSSGALYGAVAQLHANAAHLVAVPSDRDNARDRGFGVDIDLASRGPGVANRTRREPGPLDDRSRRRREDDEGESVDEVVGIHPGVESRENRTLDGKRGLMVRARRTGGEGLAQRRVELDLTQASVAVSGVSQKRGDQLLTRDETILT
jgi:hypothetical protein